MTEKTCIHLDSVKTYNELHTYLLGLKIGTIILNKYDTFRSSHLFMFRDSRPLEISILSQKVSRHPHFNYILHFIQLHSSHFQSLKSEAEYENEV